MSPNDQSIKMTAPSFGKEMKNEFLLGSDLGIPFCNHGSFGATPKVVMNERIRLLEEIERNPEIWFRQTEEQMYNKALDSVAKFLGATRSSDLAFVNNTTTAVSTILKNLELQPEDVILCTSHTYAAVLKAVDSVVSKFNADLLCIDMPVEIESEEEVLKIFEETLSLKKSVRLAIIDHISSASAILYPLKKIAKILHEHDVLVLGDGAHGPGQAEFSIEDLGVDFYVGSLHKWCYTPKGCGILWVHPKHQSIVRPLIVSHYYKMPFKEEFYMQGTRDTSQFIVVPKSLEFYERIGGRAAITGYTAELLDWAVKLMCEALGTQPQAIPDSMRAPNMRVIGFPDLSECDGVMPSHAHADDLTLQLVRDYKVVSCLCHFKGKYFMRLSANVYNEKEDYVMLRDGVKKLIEDKMAKLTS